ARARCRSRPPGRSARWSAKPRRSSWGRSACLPRRRSWTRAARGAAPRARSRTRTPRARARGTCAAAPRAGPSARRGPRRSCAEPLRVMSWSCTEDGRSVRPLRAHGLWRGSAIPLDGFDRAHEALVRKLHAGLLALAAEPVDLEAVPRRSEAVLGAHPVLDAVHLVALELRHLGALEADQVLVHGVARESVLVALEALAEVVLLDEPAPDEQIERAVDGGLPDPLAARP